MHGQPAGPTHHMPPGEFLKTSTSARVPTGLIWISRQLYKWTHVPSPQQKRNTMMQPTEACTALNVTRVLFFYYSYNYRNRSDYLIFLCICTDLNVVLDAMV